MEHKTYYSLSTTDENFDTWLNSKFISEKLRDELKNKNMLFVPSTGHAGTQTLYFTGETEQLLAFIRNANDPQVLPDICLEEQDYKELHLHAADIDLGAIIVLQAVMPVVTQLIANYLTLKYMSRNANSIVRFKMTRVSSDRKRSDRIAIEAPISEFSNIMQEVMQKLNELPDEDKLTPEQISIKSLPKSRKKGK